jgi:hypothetical protein
MKYLVAGVWPRGAASPALVPPEQIDALYQMKERCVHRDTPILAMSHQQFMLPRAPCVRQRNVLRTRSKFRGIFSRSGRKRPQDLKYCTELR